MRALAYAAAVVLLAGCARTAPDRRLPAYGNDRGEDAPVAVIDGKRLTKRALSDYWFRRYPEEYGRTLGTLVDEHLVRIQATRHRLAVPEDALARAVEAEVGARREQLRTALGPEADLAAEVRRAYGVDLETWKRDILRHRLHARLLLQRAVRWDTRRRDRIEARVIVLGDAASANATMAKLRQGADFSLTAVKVSRDPTARAGGVLPSIARGDLAFPGVEERLFGARTGQLVGPLQVTVAGVPQWQIYKIVGRQAAWTGDAVGQRARLERDLAESPVRTPEFERWRARAHRDAGVRYFDPDGRPWQPLGR